MKSFTPLTDGDVGGVIVAVGTDRDNNIYVLTSERRGLPRSYVLVYDQCTQLQRSFVADYEFEGKTVKVTSSSILLVPGCFDPGEVSKEYCTVPQMIPNRK